MKVSATAVMAGMLDSLARHRPITQGEIVIHRAAEELHHLQVPLPSRADARRRLAQ